MDFPPSHWKAEVRERLGWLRVRETMPPHLAGIRRFAEDARAGGFGRVLLLGMGGSSLFPEVLGSTLGRTGTGLDLRVLDSVLPAEVRGADRWAGEGKTLFLVASKSGNTIEVSSLYRHFAASNPPSRFAAITDPGSPLEALGKAKGFRSVFLNPSDIGGRYSALSLFGLVPAALLGWDPARFLTGDWKADEALARELASRDTFPLAASPFSDWVEQLVAESLGKEGNGVLPIPGGEGGIDPLGGTATPERLGAECFRWEAATALAGSILGVNPFDQPDVEDAKARTKALLAGTPTPEPGTPEPSVRAFLSSLEPGRILAVLAWLPRTGAAVRALEAFRARLGRPSALNWGPRYLHSTGQFHKGGADRCAFLMLTGANGDDLPIPGESYTFGGLARAQALGDLAALRARGRRVLPLPLPEDPAAAIDRLG